MLFRSAQRLGIPVFAIVDTNSNPDNIDFVIPANDDANKSIEVILDACCAAIAEGLEERKAERVDAETASKDGGKADAESARVDDEAEEAEDAPVEE